MKSKKGQIATILTLVAMGLMTVGIGVGTWALKNPSSPFYSEAASCTGISYSLSPSSPESNTTVTVDITRPWDANKSCQGNWDNIGLELDGVSQPGGQITDGNTYRWTINSDGAGTHTLQFTVNNGACKCNSKTFTTTGLAATPTPTQTATPAPLTCQQFCNSKGGNPYCLPEANAPKPCSHWQLGGTWDENHCYSRRIYGSSTSTSDCDKVCYCYTYEGESDCCTADCCMTTPTPTPTSTPGATATPTPTPGWCEQTCHSQGYERGGCTAYGFTCNWDQTEIGYCGTQSRCCCSRGGPCHNACRERGYGWGWCVMFADCYEGGDIGWSPCEGQGNRTCCCWGEAPTTTPTLTATPTPTSPPAATATPTPTPAECRYEAGAYVKEKTDSGEVAIKPPDINNFTITSVIHGDNGQTYTFANQAFSHPDEGKHYFSTSNLSRDYIGTADVTLNFPTSNWEIVNTFCTASGTGRCPSSAGQAVQTLTGFKSDCGATYDRYGWTLKRVGPPPTATPVPTATPTPTATPKPEKNCRSVCGSEFSKQAWKWGKNKQDYEDFKKKYKVGLNTCVVHPDQSDYYRFFYTKKGGDYFEVGCEWPTGPTATPMPTTAAATPTPTITPTPGYEPPAPTATPTTRPPTPTPTPACDYSSRGACEADCPGTCSGSGSCWNCVTEESADMNDDGIVNAIDYDVVVTNYGVTGVGVRGDINRDGVANALDISLLIRFIETTY